jgi:hypothetical protein
MQLHPEIGRVLAANYMNDALAAASSRRQAKAARRGPSATTQMARCTTQADRRGSKSSLGPALCPEAPRS